MLIDNDTYERLRWTQSVNGDGEVVVQGPTREEFHDGSIQPITEEDIEHLEGGDRSDVEWKLITSADLRGPDQHESKPADQVEWGDKRFRIKEIEGGYDALIPHNTYALIREQE